MKYPYCSRGISLANKVRKIGLNSKDIQDAINDLKSIKQDISSLPENIEDILDEAVRYCQSLTPISDKQGNHLRYNTYWEKTSTGYRIVQEGENVAFVEFGTGAVGTGSPHDKASTFGWAYGVGKHIFTTKSGRRGWFFPTDESYTSFRFTEGQKANMQVYKTGIWLEKRLNQEIKMTMKRVNDKW